MKRLAALMACVVLYGCTVGPDYHRPAGALINASGARGAFMGSSSAAFITTAPPGKWWELYHDPLLDGLIRRALAANTNLRLAAANIRHALAGLAIVSDAQYPSTVTSGSAAYSRLSPQQQLMPKANLPAVYVYDLGAKLSYQVDLFGQIRRATEEATADVGAAREAYDATRITIVAATTQAYVAVCSAGREIAITQKLIDFQTRSTKLTERLFRQGRGSPLDVSRAKALEERLRASTPPLEAARRVALYRLAVLTGRPPADFPKAVTRCARDPQLRQEIPVGDGASLLARRPDVRRAEYELHAATAGVGVATADLYPKIVFGASVDSVGPTSAFLEHSTLKYSLGPLISWEFPNRQRAEAEISSANASVDAAYARFDAAVLAALREVEDALTVYAHDLDQRALLESSRAHAAHAAEDAQTLFKYGRRNYLEVLQANIALIEGDQAIARLDTKIADNQIAVFLALGGDWTPGRANQPREKH